MNWEVFPSIFWRRLGRIGVNFSFRCKCILSLGLKLSANIPLAKTSHVAVPNVNAESTVYLQQGELQVHRAQGMDAGGVKPRNQGVNHRGLGAHFWCAFHPN